VGGNYQGTAGCKQMSGITQTAQNSHSSSTVLLLIGAFKLFKAVLLIVVGLGALKLIDRDVSEQLAHWVSQLRIDPDNRYIDAAIEKIGLLSDRQLRQIGVGSFIYATLLLIEGVGLVLRKHWAEYFTIIMTASLLPLEIMEIARRVTVVRVTLFVVNLAIVGYLMWRVRRDRMKSP
jgi:uncharacterized membrane protein (DUF2068 family)